MNYNEMRNILEIHLHILRYHFRYINGYSVDKQSLETNCRLLSEGFIFTYLITNYKSGARKPDVPLRMSTSSFLKMSNNDHQLISDGSLHYGKVYKVVVLGDLLILQ